MTDALRSRLRMNRLLPRIATLPLALLSLGMPALAQTSVATPEASPTQTDHAQALSLPDMPLANLADLARQGQFVQVLENIKANPEWSDLDSLKQLTADLEIYRQHQSKHTAERQKNFESARDAMVKQTQENNLDIALIRAIDAHANAPQGRQWLADQQVVELVEKSKTAARQAEQEGDWLAALTLWRNLDLLYLEDSTFRQQVRNAEQHARLLRLYAPNELQRLHIQRESRKGNPTPEPLSLGNDTWQARLADIRIGMMYDALREAKNRHIDNPTYAQLLLGSLERLDTLLEAAGLSATFANMHDAGRVAQFKSHLASVKEQVHGVSEEFTYRQLLHAVNGILIANKQTVDLPESILIYEMTDGALAKLDPFTSVIWPHDLAQFSRNTEGRFSGVGIQISRPGRLTATQVTHESPASRAGVQEGDLITHINGADASSMGVNEAIRKLNPAEGQSTLTLQADRPGHVGSLTFTLEGITDADSTGLRLARPGKLTVVSPLPGTPAHRAGIKPNDLIVSVDGQDTTGWSLDQAVRAITGKEGTQVVIGIQRTGRDEPLDFALTRTSIEMESVRGWKLSSNGKWDYYIDPQRQIGYIRLMQFIPQSSDELEAAFDEMNRHGRVQAVILDLRYNPGGLLRKAADVVDRFVRSGRIVSTVDAKGNTTSQYSARPHNTLRAIPMVVLINQGSASASEIVSGALQDYQTALIVGSRSYGKGSVQDLTPIDGGKALIKLTTQYYKLPGGRIIHRKPDAAIWGIEPDLAIPMTEQQAFDAIELRRDLDVLHESDEDADPAHPRAKAEDMFTRALDPQLEAALMYLRVRLTANATMPPRPATADRSSPSLLPMTP